jgi:methylenetetrahydrofolate dehydrogenase (NADP+)/methenyltetrahydrofolate cyclohydrolase
MTTLLKSKPLIDQKIDDLRQKCTELKERGITPSMKVILVGEHAASLIYTRNKKRFCEKFGADCEIINLDESISPEEFTQAVNKIANDDKVHGCFVQLPLPKQLNEVDVPNLIPSHKDVDGFHSHNIAALFQGDKGENALLPCTPKGVITLCDFYNIPLEGKHIVIIGRSTIVGKPLGMMMTNHNATVTICHSRTQDLKEITKTADIIAVAIGRAKYLTKDYLSTSKKQIIIDVGINHDENGKLCGDVDFNDVHDSVEAITPVPGGVGPMTILTLAQNLLQAAEKSL